MAVKFNPFTGQLQIDEKGSGGGSSYIDGEAAAYGDLSLDAGVAPLNSAWLVREASGTWLLGRKPAGIYIRTATAGVSRDADYTYAGILPDVFSDANFTLYDDGDSTKNAKFQLSSIATGTTRTITVPDANVTLPDQGTSTTDSPTFAGLTSQQWQSPTGQVVLDFEDHIFEVTNEGEKTLSVSAGQISVRDWQNDTAATFLAYNNLTANRTYDLPDRSGELMIVGDAPASHTHGNLTSDGKIGSTAGLPVVTTTAGAVTTLALGTANQVLRVNSGATGVEFADPAASGVTGAASSASDVLGVSGANITGVDANADRIVFWDDSASALKYLEAGSGLSISGTTLTATASGGSKTYATFTAEHNQPPSTAFATLDTRNSIAVLDFDAATDENAVFVGIMPEAASLGSGLIVRLHWMATSATSGNVRWGVQFERSNTDLDSDSFAAAVEANGAANGTSGILTTTAITVTDFDGITAGDVFRLKVYRNADDATNDTMTGDAELVAVEVRSAA